jgi:DNA-binding CsgD family transcriptional regulator
MPDQAEILDVLYGVIANQDGWTRFLEHLATDFGGGVMVRTSPNPLPGTRKLPPGADANEAAGVCMLASLAVSIAMKGISQHEFSSPSHRIASRIFENEMIVADLIVRRPQRLQAFLQSEIEVWNQFIPHVRRVVACLVELARWKAERGLLVALDALSFGIAVVACDGTLLFASREASEIIACGDHLTVFHGRLRMMAADQDQWLESVLRRYASVSSAEIEGEIFALPSAREEGTISGYIMPVPLSDVRVVVPAAVLILHDRFRDSQPSQSALAARYGLSSAEGKLLSELVRGHSLRECAAIAGISQNTARTYLYQIFTKSGHHRQLDLVRAVVSDWPIWVASGKMPRQARNGSQG